MTIAGAAAKNLHAVWTLPPNDAELLDAMAVDQTGSERCQTRRSSVHQARNERGIWQRRFWEHLIRDDADYARHVEYCYINPVKHGLVRRVRDWPHSSFHRDTRRGLFPLDWAGEVEPTGEFGERKL